MKKVLYLDVETTGLNPHKNDIIQIACIVEINGSVSDGMSSKIRPFDMESIDPKALETNKLKLSDLETFENPRAIHKLFIKMLSKYINKFDKNDKLVIAGYNVRFDVNFLSNFFRKCGDKYFGSWFNWRCVDPLYQLYYLDYKGKISLQNYKLETVCSYFNIDIQAHDALSDIKATRELVKRLETEGLW